ncbi:Zn-ribbon domain-containing OB-fold protein [Rhodococcus sp. NPDC057014]|uniref:Zn-ribbon domain-containing OB-fold protein n=1 Tax=Rhodococcus sp. NPDC057014 TaxID=3346000 RepID=UPI00363BED0A
MTPQLPAPTPMINPETQYYWDAAKSGRFVLKRCRACGVVVWYPRAICPDCWSTDTEWFEASGRGSVYTFTIVRRGAGPYAECGPYVVAYVELAEGPRVMTNIVGDDVLSRIEIGSAVEVVFHPTNDAVTALPRFRLT